MVYIKLLNFHPMVRIINSIYIEIEKGTKNARWDWMWILTKELKSTFAASAQATEASSSASE